MDEYDEMYGIEDDFEKRFADELEVMAEMEMEPSPPYKRSEYRKPKPQLASLDGDHTSKSQSKPPTGSTIQSQLDDEDIEHLLRDQPLTPKAKRARQEVGVAKRLFDHARTDDVPPPSLTDNITPPSSPEQYQAPRAHRSAQSLLDISGFAAIQESPRRVALSLATAPLATAPRHVLKRPPVEGGYVTVTDSSGNRVYLRQAEDTGSKLVDRRTVLDAQGHLGLLAVPVEVLREQVAERRHQLQVEEALRLSELLARGVQEDLVDLGGRLIEEEEEEEEGNEEGRSNSRLWVDKFSPAHYTELLSDDFTNRCLLKWLKLWDTVVFGKERKTRPKASERQAPNQNPANQNAIRFKTKSQMTEELLDAELDQLQRPKYKVALLSGPPGMGKTTLAHIIAKHAGYNVVEINASDDRSAELFQTRIDTATQMKSVLGANQRPNCLIIDEIDGAPAAAINVLIATLNKKDGQGAGTESVVETEKKKKKKKESILLRPIICICNDLYVPALRPLRQQAFLLAFPQTQPSRLVQRLAEISHRQGMKADTGTLMALCEKTDNDIRSCINTLQFLHGRGRRQVDARTVQNMSVGQKDQNKGLFHLWQEIFQLPRTKRRRMGEAEDMLKEGGGAQRFQHILLLASSSGEYDKVTQGLYDNFLSMRIRDHSLNTVCDALDWLSFSDRLNETMMQGQNFSLMRYLPFLSITFHFLFANTNVPRINYPHSQNEALFRSQSSKNALASMLNDIPPCIRSRVSEFTLTNDVLTLLLDIICPKLRPVNPQLFSSREKQQLSDLIDTMLSYNLCYRQDRTPEGQYTYVLEPRMEEVVMFPGLPPRRQLTYQAKQTISREMEQERMRRAEQLMLLRNPVKRPEKEKAADTRSIKNHQQRLQNIVRQTTVEVRPELDFFGRALVPKQKPQLVSDTGEVCAEVAMGTAVGNSDVWFRFNEGVSNAVRRNVYMRELL
ncbi:chromosome transmission fidelity protein 18 homolog [Aplochiton taeniatus]